MSAAKVGTIYPKVRAHVNQRRVKQTARLSSTQYQPCLSNPSLRYSLYDGLAYSVTQGSGETYLSAYGIFLKALPLQVGMLATLPPLIGALLQSYGVWLMERLRRRRPILVWLSIGLGLLWLPIGLIPLIAGPGQQSVKALIFLACLYFALAGFLAPVWNSLIGDLVPEHWRGRYFGMRSRACGLVVFFTMLLAGSILYAFECYRLAAYGFLAIFLLAAAGRLSAAIWLGRYDDPPLEVTAKHKFSFLDFMRRAPSSNFAKFVFFTAAVNLAVNFSGPYFAIYMLRELRLSYFQYTLIGAAAIMAQFFTLQHWGYLCDRFGNKKILNITILGVALNPIAWLLSAKIWYLVLAQLFSGFVWAGFNLAVGNFLFDAVTPPKRARCAAYQAIVNGLFVVSGALLGGWYASGVDAANLAQNIVLFPESIYFQLFLISGLLRLGAALLLLPRFREVRQVEPIRHRRLIFQVVHLRPISGFSFGPFSTARQAKKGRTGPHGGKPLAGAGQED